MKFINFFVGLFSFIMFADLEKKPYFCNKIYKTILYEHINIESCLIA